MKANGFGVPDLFGYVPPPSPIDIPVKQSQSQSTLTGRVAEFMVCAYLTELGYEVVHIDTIGYDVILHCPGHSFKIDVKSTTHVHIGPRKQTVFCYLKKAYWLEGRASRTRRKLLPSDCDLVAIYYTPLKAVAYVPIIGPTKNVNIPLAQFRSDPLGETSLLAAIEKKVGK
jgi:hypothetical protein